MSADTIGLWAGFALTLMIFSYLLGDNVLYRLAIYAFVGLAAGFVTMVTWENVVAPYLQATLLSGDAGAAVFGAVPLVFGALLLLKVSNRLHRLGNIPLAFLIGVGAAVALVGAISGTLLPLAGSVVEGVRDAASTATSATTITAASTAPATGDVGGNAISGNATALTSSFLILLGVVCTLLYFQFVARRAPVRVGQSADQVDLTPGVGTRRGALVRVFGGVGQGVIAITFGALYAGAILTGLIVLTDRVGFLLAQLGLGG